jgi:hypothetical protein
LQWLPYPQLLLMLRHSWMVVRHCTMLLLLLLLQGVAPWSRLLL